MGDAPLPPGAVVVPQPQYDVRQTPPAPTTPDLATPVVQGGMVTQPVSLDGILFADVGGPRSRTNRLASRTPGTDQTVRPVPLDKLLQKESPASSRFGPVTILPSTPTLRATKLEAELEEQLPAVMADKGNHFPHRIHFDGEELYLEDSMTVETVNQKLSDAKSSKRLFAQGAEIVYGQVRDLPNEIERLNNGQRARVITFDELQFSTLPTEAQGVTNSGKTSAILTRQIIKTLETFEKLYRSEPISNTVPNREIIASAGKEFCEKMGGAQNLSNVALREKSVRYHETQHIIFSRKYGDAILYLKGYLRSEDINSFEEAYSDLNSLQYLVSLHKSKSETGVDDARKGLILYIITHPTSMAVSTVIRTAVTVKGGKITVDWDRFESNVTSFQGLLETIFKDLTSNIQVKAGLKNKTNLGPHSQEVVALERLQTQNNLDLIQKEYPLASQEMVKNISVNQIVRNLVRDTDSQNFFKDKISGYKKQIEGWTSSRASH